MTISGATASSGLSRFAHGTPPLRQGLAAPLKTRSGLTRRAQARPPPQAAGTPNLQGINRMADTPTEAVEQIISAWAFAHNIDGAARNDLFARLRSSAPQEPDETGWLIEEDAGGFIHWIALAEDAWPRTEVKDRRIGARTSRSFERYLSPVRRVKDANEALRFARKQDAEAFIKLFDRFLLCPVATEHCWPEVAQEPVVDDAEWLRKEARIACASGLSKEAARFNAIAFRLQAKAPETGE